MTTVATFHAALSGLSITGVKRQYTYQPNTLNTADLPASFPQMPGLEYAAGGEWASTCEDTSKVHTGTLVVAVEAAGQDMTTKAFNACVTMQDNLATALDAWTAPAYLDYSTSFQPVNIGGVDYWAVRAVVTARYLG